MDDAAPREQKMNVDVLMVKWWELVAGQEKSFRTPGLHRLLPYISVALIFDLRRSA